jgi:hypothetical protein
VKALPVGLGAQCARASEQSRLVVGERCEDFGGAASVLGVVGPKVGFELDGPLA